MRLNLIVLILFFTLSCRILAQSNNSEAALYNIGISSIGSGIGALINKNSEEKWGKVFLKGLWQGAVGGYLIYESKNIIGKIPTEENWSYSWGAKLVNSVGTSIVENASSNKDFWEVWHINIGFNRIELHTKNKFQLRYKLMPVSFMLTTGTAINSKFEWERSLETGEMIFSTRDSHMPNANAITLGNIIRSRSGNINNHQIISHEIIHIYQYYDYNFLNTYLIKTKKNLGDNSRTMSFLNNHLYWDFQGLTTTGLYFLGNINRNCHFDNFFEHEAEYYTAPFINCQ